LNGVRVRVRVRVPVRVRVNGVLVCMLLLGPAACAPRRAPVPAPASAASAPSLAGAAVLVLPVQGGTVPTRDSTAHHWAADRAALDAEIAYWLKQTAPRSKWLLYDAIDRALQRSPGLDVQPRDLAVAVFSRAQVRRIGDPLFGDIRKLAAVLDAQVAVVPVAAEFIGPSREAATLNIAAAVIALDADVLWFGVIAGNEPGVGSEAALASAAQAFARAFAEKKPPGDN